jgi:hypothetical protein
MRAKVLYLSGSIAFAFALLHCSFWALFDWAGELSRLSAMNGAIVQMLNIATIFVCVFKGLISFVLAKKQGPFSAVEKYILVFVGGSSFLRAAFGFPLFGINTTEIVVVMICLTAALASMLALWIPGQAGMSHC